MKHRIPKFKPAGVPSLSFGFIRKCSHMYGGRLHLFCKSEQVKSEMPQKPCVCGLPSLFVTIVIGRLLPTNRPLSHVQCSQRHGARKVLGASKCEGYSTTLLEQAEIKDQLFGAVERWSTDIESTAPFLIRWRLRKVRISMGFPF